MIRLSFNQKVSEISNEHIDYEITMLNFDPCNLELHQTFSDTTKWDIRAFWLSDLDESKMRLIEQPDGGWGLILETNGAKVKLDTERSFAMSRSVHLLGQDRSRLIVIGQAFHYAIRACKEMGRKGVY